MSPKMTEDQKAAFLKKEEENAQFYRNKAKSNGERDAFPASETATCGLTKREFFAVKILQGMMANPLAWGYDIKEPQEDCPLGIVEDAAFYATRLLQELQE